MDYREIKYLKLKLTIIAVIVCFFAFRYVYDRVEVYSAFAGLDSNDRVTITIPLAVPGGHTKTLSQEQKSKLFQWLKASEFTCYDKKAGYNFEYSLNFPKKQFDIYKYYIAFNGKSYILKDKEKREEFFHLMYELHRDGERTYPYEKE